MTPPPAALPGIADIAAAVDVGRDRDGRFAAAVGLDIRLMTGVIVQGDVRAEVRLHGDRAGDAPLSLRPTSRSRPSLLPRRS